MLTENDAIQLYRKYIEVKNSGNKTLLTRVEKEVVTKFDYLVRSDAKKYQAFSNYQDLLQEGYIVLFKALNNYNESKGNIFYWLHQYVGTRISRRANKFSIIDIPLQKGKLPQYQFKRSDMMYKIREDKENPEKNCLLKEMGSQIKTAISNLNGEHRELLESFFGFDENSTKYKDIPEPEYKVKVRRAITILKRKMGNLQFAE
jgi:DNA-directed RNA polymerase specialized sigma subunit